MAFYDSSYASAAAVYDNMEPPEPEVIGLCCICDGEIYNYEDYFEVDGELVCDECPRLYMIEKFRKEAEAV